jgi:hypothetical protein
LEIPLAVSCCLFLLSLAGGTSVGAVPPNPLDDGAGKQWRQLYETTGMTWNQVAQLCPRDGATGCTGSLTDWTWATDAQVLDLFRRYAPAIGATSPATVAGPEYFLIAGSFLGEMRWTASFALTYQFAERAEGWTASTAPAGTLIAAWAAYGFPPASGAFTAVPSAAGADAADSTRGVWLWRSSAGDHTPPAIAPTVTGTAGANGWYVSDVSVSWSVDDPDSPVTSQMGCGGATVSTDTSGTAFTCSATSAGGTASGSTTVMRDVTPPTITCGSPAPVFQLTQLGASVPATVLDATSGPTSAATAGVALTGAAGSFRSTVTATDRAGNRATRLCPYQVAIPSCNGLVPTRVGTGQSDVINGTAGRDVIVGLGGNDTINGQGGDDVICGGDGADTIDGGNGNDWLDGGPGLDSRRGSAGTDTCLSGEARLSSCEL